MNTGKKVSNCHLQYSVDFYLEYVATVLHPLLIGVATATYTPYAHIQ